ncbi:hypothetical protein [Haloglomus litoreum]|uniref:hypothetical protein n=1 Tax=Haloglomus litoreum TaxID=3034026 RepID=UPI0023E8ED2E|nr:hypothetical protein [Haloglomus sp. DT116]
MIFELVEAVLGFLAEHVGVELGVSISALALVIVGIWYGRELSTLLVGAARWVRIGSVVVGVVALVVIGGVTTGALSLDSGVVAQLLELLGSVAEGL